MDVQEALTSKAWQRAQWLFQFGDTADRMGKIKVGAHGEGGSVWIGGFWGTHDIRAVIG